MNVRIRWSRIEKGLHMGIRDGSSNIVRLVFTASESLGRWELKGGSGLEAANHDLVKGFSSLNAAKEMAQKVANEVRSEREFTSLIDNQAIRLIQWGAVRNKRTKDNVSVGWAPMVWENNKKQSSDWTALELDLDQALSAARREAKEKAGKYLGDWVVQVEPREPASKARSKPKPKPPTTGKGSFSVWYISGAESLLLRGDLTEKQALADYKALKKKGRTAWVEKGGEFHPVTGAMRHPLKSKRPTTKRQSASKCKPFQEGCQLVHEYWRKKAGKK